MWFNFFKEFILWLSDIDALSRQFWYLFLPHNWPHIVQALRLSLCLNMILLPILNLLISSMAVAVWENIGKYVFLAIMLCNVFLPIYVVGKKYE